MRAYGKPHLSWFDTIPPPKSARRHWKKKARQLWRRLVRLGRD